MKGGYWCAVVGIWAAVVGWAGESPRAERVILVANLTDADSVRIARHYAEARGVPMANIIALRLPNAEEITWPEFISALWQPLLTQLVAARWIDAIPMALTDGLGRQKMAVSGHRIEALVICRGVPLKIAHAAEYFSEVLPLTKRREFRTNAGSVDSELSLLARSNYPITAFVENPLFANDRPSAAALGEVIRVARLDGPTAEAANSLVDRAVAAERTGLLGRAYVDIANRDDIGDPWLESVAAQLAALGFAPAVDRSDSTMLATARIDAPVLYFGWYAENVEGPFALPGFRFPPGAIALHIHSHSASSLRVSDRGWAGPFVARGVTATLGNVYEPYLELTHQPHLFLRALARGSTLAEAAYYSIKALSWQGVLIGDPLYRPWTVSWAAQMENFLKLPEELAGYATLRRMREWAAAGRGEEALAWAASLQRERPHLAVGVELARQWSAAGDLGRAGQALGFVRLRQGFSLNEAALAREAALRLEQCGRPQLALEVWQVLLAGASCPPALKIAWLPEARQRALAVDRPLVAAAWQTEWNSLISAAAEKSRPAAAP